MTGRVAALALAATVVAGCRAADPASGPEGVYEAALTRLAHVYRVAPSWEPVLEGSTSYRTFPRELQDLANLRRRMPTLRRGTLESFLALPSGSSPLAYSPPRSSSVKVLSATDYGQIFMKSTALEENWGRFYDRFPDATGLVSFSGVGFSRDRRQALVYCAIDVGRDNGASWLMLFERSDDGWSFQAERAVRIG